MSPFLPYAVGRLQSCLDLDPAAFGATCLNALIYTAATILSLSGVKSSFTLQTLSSTQPRQAIQPDIDFQRSIKWKKLKAECS
jgi:hypothetical protein